jgi:hypothetical protein
MFKPDHSKDFYYCYNPKLRDFEQQTVRMENESIIDDNFSTVIPLDDRFIFVISDGGVDEDKLEAILKVGLADKTIGS